MGTSKSSVDPSAGTYTDYTTPPTSGYRESSPREERQIDTSRLDHETSDEIRDDINSTRNRMDETLDELGDRLSPRRLVDEVVNFVSGPKTRETATRAGESAAEFGQNLGRTIRDNPVPTLLIGAGLAWLMFGESQADRIAKRQRMARRRREFTSNDLDYDDAYERLYDTPGSEFVRDEAYYDRFYDEDFSDDELRTPSGDFMSGSYGSQESKAKDASSKAGETVSGAASSASQGISDAASTVVETVKDASSTAASAVSSTASSLASGIAHAGESVADTARRVYRKGRRSGAGAYRYGTQSGRRASQSLGRQSHQLVELYDRAADHYHEASREYPLAVGAGCLALGMLTGLLVPGTRREDEWMGEASDELRHEAWDAGEEMVERGKQVASATAAKATDSAQQHGLTGESLLERGERVASKVVATASEALDQEGLSPTKIGEELKAVGKETGQTAADEATKVGEDAKQKAKEVDSDLKPSSPNKSTPPGKPSAPTSSASTTPPPPPKPYPR